MAKPRNKQLQSTQTLSQLDNVLRIIRKNWPLIVATVLVSTGASLLYTKSLPKIYSATALLQFEPDPPRPMSKEANPFHAWTSFFDNHEVFETQYKIITSESILSSVAHDLSLTSDQRFGGSRGSPALLEDVTSTLRTRLKVEPMKGTRLFDIKYEDTDPKQAKRICEAIARTFIAKNLEKETSATSDAAAWLTTQTDTTKHNLETSEDALQDFKRSNELPSSSIDEISKMVRSEMTTYDETLTHLKTKREEIAARLADLSKIATEDPDAVPTSELQTNGFLNELRKAYMDGLLQRNELLASGKGEQHPSVMAANEKMEAASRAFQQEIHNIHEALSNDLEIVEHELNGDNKLYDEAKKRGVELNLKEVEYHRLDRIRVEDEKLYATLLEQLKGADLDRLMNVNTVLLIDTPLEPKAPVRPNVLLNVAVGALTGLALGMALMVLREQLDSSLRAPADVEKQLGLVFLGLLPQLEDDDDMKQKRNGARRRQSQGPPLAHVELVVHANPTGGIAETARSIRTNLMFMNPDRPFRKLLISSAAPSEGKTTVACSIAIAFAQGGQRVCIIDCDLRRPRLHRIFDRVGDIGVTSVLLGDATVDEVAKPTIVENLWSVPAGPLPPNPADILHSEKFKKFLDDLAARFDRVVIDSPPLVPITDSAIISTLVDGTVFVVRAGTTSKHVSAQGLRSLRDVDARVVGAVLNAVNLRKAEYGYYYKYYYYRRTEPAVTPPPPTSSSSAAPPN